MNKKWVVIVVSILVGFIIFYGILFVSSEKNKNDAVIATVFYPKATGLASP